MTIRLPRPLLWVLALLLAAGAGALVTYLVTDGAGTTSSASSARGQQVADVRVPGDCRNLQAAPADVTFTCADGGVRAQDVGWRNWGAEVAVGEGTVLARDCTPDCASSNRYDAFRVVLVAQGLKSCGPSDRRYTRVGYSWPAGSPYPPDAPGSQEPYLTFDCRQ